MTTFITLVTLSFSSDGLNTGGAFLTPYEDLEELLLLFSPYLFVSIISKILGFLFDIKLDRPGFALASWPIELNPSLGNCALWFKVGIERSSSLRST